MKNHFKVERSTNYGEFRVRDELTRPSFCDNIRHRFATFLLAIFGRRSFVKVFTRESNNNLKELISIKVSKSVCGHFIKVV